MAKVKRAQGLSPMALAYSPFADFGGGGFSGGSASPFPNVYNWNPQTNLAGWRTKRAQVIGGSARGKIACCGDSTTLGWGSGVGTAYTGAHDLSYPTRLAAYLQAGGVNTTIQSSIANFGGGITTATIFVLYNPRVSRTGSGWGTVGAPSAGGNGWFNSTTTADVLSFTPSGNVDTIVLFYLQNTTLGTFSWNLDGGADTNIVTAGTQAFKTATLSTSLASHVVNIKRVSGQVFFTGWLAYDSTSAAFDVLNLGWGGSTSTLWNDTSAAWAPLTSIGVHAPDLTILNLGINDWEAAVSQVTYSTNIQALITAAKLSGDVILCMPTPTGATATANDQAAYFATLMTLASSNNVVLVDWTGRYTSYSVQNAAGHMFDTLHPKAFIYDDEGAFLSQLLIAA